MKTNEFGQLSSIEITGIPRKHIGKHQREPVDKSTSDVDILTHTRFISVLMRTLGSFGYHIGVENGHSRIMYLSSKPETLTAAFNAHFPEFNVAAGYPIHIPDSLDNLVSVKIWGVPEQSPIPLNSCVELLLSSGVSGFYHVAATSKKPGRVSRYFAKMKYTKALEKSQIQKSETSWLGGQQTISKFNVDMKDKSKLYEARYKRMNADLILRCETYLVMWGSYQTDVHLQNTLNALLASLSSVDRKSGLKCQINRGKKSLQLIENIIDMKLSRKSTNLLPQEAVPYLSLPTVEMGISQHNPATFSTSGTVSTGLLPIAQKQTIPIRKGYICTGRPYRSGSLDERNARYLPIEDLRKHMLILGMTGSGKSTTKNRIVIDAWRNGIPSLLIEPIKTDARMLMGAIPELRVFTDGCACVRSNVSTPNSFLIHIPLLENARAGHRITNL
ncbi:MAG: DUF87 domain-containing protein [Candidatus Thorarchaeota archaeon]|nr:DUF87 domain-containing protein [Candidatus Thorarchaeota archaeon]